jgi:hypothetical protein
MCDSPTSYHFKIITSDEIMEVFGTVMSRSSENIDIDLWCPEEPRLNFKVTLTTANIPQMLEDLLRDNLAAILPSGSSFSLSYLPY